MKSVRVKKRATGACFLFPPIVMGNSLAQQGRQDQNQRIFHQTRENHRRQECIEDPAQNAASRHPEVEFGQMSH